VKDPRLVGGNQGAQALVDLAVLPLAALLHPLHREESDADADERDRAEPEQSREQRRPGREV
jgi:hypothetical protein